jgi:hypothetical protein
MDEGPRHRAFVALGVDSRRSLSDDDRVRRLALCAASLVFAVQALDAAAYVEGSGSRSPWGLVLQTTKGRVATTAALGETLVVVGWSPKSMRGTRFQLCVARPTLPPRCRSSSRYVLAGTAPHALDTWKVARGEGRSGYFKLFLLVDGRVRAFDRVPLI